MKQINFKKTLVGLTLLLGLLFINFDLQAQTNRNSEREELLRFRNYIHPAVKEESLKYVHPDLYLFDNTSMYWVNDLNLYRRSHSLPTENVPARPLTADEKVRYKEMDFSSYSFHIIDVPGFYPMPKSGTAAYMVQDKFSANETALFFYRGTITRLKYTGLRADTFMGTEGYKVIEEGPYKWSADGSSFQWLGVTYHNKADLERNK
jgi:hypothetical protein